MRAIYLTLASVLISSLGFAADATLVAEARTTLEKATAYMRSISTEGGYLWKYSLDLTERAGEVKATASQVWVQPPGTPSMGMAFLRLHEATKDARYLDAAKAAADALARGQLESGGWDYPIDFDPDKMKLSYLRADVGKVPPDQAAKRKNTSTFDDNTSQSALRLLLAVADASKGSKEPRDARIREARDYGLKKMLESQYPNGAWPQRWRGEAHPLDQFPVVKARYPETYSREYPKTNYFALYTLNDNTMHDCIATMLDAYRRLGKAEYLTAAKKGGDFFILAQLPEPQPVWAQQYNPQMEPAWARAFEPPAMTGNESVGAILTLMELYVETGDEKYLKPIPAAIEWFKRSNIGPNTWARYYELKTNKQIFGDRDGRIYYRLQDISEERQGNYSWSGAYGVTGMIAEYEKLKSVGREKFAASKAPKPLSASAKAERAKDLEKSVRAAIASLDSAGRWVIKGDLKKRDWQFHDRVDTTLFIKNADVLARFLEAAQ
jgi:hypothetical protein